MRLPCCLLLLASLACATTAGAQQPAPLTATPPDAFNFTGTWDCTGAFGNGRRHKSTFTGAIILGGRWIELTEQDLEPATGYLAKYLIGYDAQQKLLVEFDANNFSAATYTSSEGWQGHVLTMTSPISSDPKAPYAANRFLYSFTTPNSFNVDWQISKTTALNWLPSDHLACERRTTA